MAFWREWARILAQGSPARRRRGRPVVERQRPDRQPRGSIPPDLFRQLTRRQSIDGVERGKLLVVAHRPDPRTAVGDDRPAVAVECESERGAQEPGAFPDHFAVAAEGVPPELTDHRGKTADRPALQVE